MQSYLPQIGDTVTTVSLQFGEVVYQHGQALHIRRRDHSFYVASVQAVIRVVRGDQTYVVARGRTRSALLPYETSWAQREFMQYMANRKM